MRADIVETANGAAVVALHHEQGARIVKEFDSRIAAEHWLKAAGYYKRHDQSWEGAFYTCKAWQAVEVLWGNDVESKPCMSWADGPFEFHLRHYIYGVGLNMFGFGYGGKVSMTASGTEYPTTNDPVLEAVAPPGITIQAIGAWSSSAAAKLAAGEYIRRLINVYGEPFFKQLLRAHFLAGVGFKHHLPSGSGGVGFPD